MTKDDWRLATIGAISGVIGGAIGGCVSFALVWAMFPSVTRGRGVERPSVMPPAPGAQASDKTIKAPFGTQPISEAGVPASLAACANEAKKYCGDIVPGGGQLRRCLLKREPGELNSGCIEGLRKLTKAVEPGGWPTKFDNR